MGATVSLAGSPTATDVTDNPSAPPTETCDLCGKELPAGWHSDGINDPECPYCMDTGIYGDHGSGVFHGTVSPGFGTP